MESVSFQSEGEMEITTLRVSKDVSKRLTYLKLKKNAKTIEQILVLLLESYENK